MAHDISNHDHDHHHQSNTARIWKVFGLLSLVTIVEVILGIFKPEVLNAKFLALKLLNWIFIVLTIYKAYLITWAFMHMEQEAKWLRRAVVWTSVFLICYLMAILLVEGDYIFEVYKNGYKSWDF